MRHAVMFGLVLAVLGAANSAHALWPCGQTVANCQASQNPWSGPYYNPTWGVPIALVAPPTAKKESRWGWDVGNTRVTTITHQFHRNYPWDGYYDATMPTPPSPSDTTQFGYYYVRGPWK